MKKYFILALALILSFSLISMGSLNGIEHIPQSSESLTLSNSDFLMTYYRTVENSLNRNPKVGKLGTATIDGLKSGSFHYRGKLGFFKVTIEMTYDNYCDFDVVVTGKSVVECSLAANGKMTGEMYVAGPVSGNIVLDLDLTKGLETGGYYYVTQDGKPSEIFDYSFVIDHANREFEIEAEE
ncbi:MAG: hypothetical protein JXR63_01615 [Spirochaetales bacterium]|nr:hypothetical protein [Spirochaetales bacterium]